MKRSKFSFLLIIAAVLAAAMAAPVLLFALEDHVRGSQVYTQNRHVTENSLSEMDYIADDALRVATYLSRVSEGTGYQAVSLDMSWTFSDVCDLMWQGALTCDMLYDFLDILYSVDPEDMDFRCQQYAVCNTLDYSDVIFLPLLISFKPYDSTSRYNVLIDSQTGAFYFATVAESETQWIGREDKLSSWWGITYTPFSVWRASEHKVLWLYLEILYCLGFPYSGETEIPEDTDVMAQQTKDNIYTIWIHETPLSQPEGADVKLTLVFQEKYRAAEGSKYYFGLKEFGELFPALGYTPILEEE